MDLPNELQRAVFRLSRALRSAADQAGISAVDAVLLATIRKAPGIGVSALAAQENVSRSVISERVTKLETSGLIRRAEPADDGDRRRVGLSLTPAGLKVFAAVAGRRRAVIEQRLSALTVEQRLALERAVPVLDLLAEADITAQYQQQQQQGGEQ
jgi:DNA-binding MarR family transcriptional regulator